MPRKNQVLREITRFLAAHTGWVIVILGLVMIVLEVADHRGHFAFGSPVFRNEVVHTALHAGMTMIAFWVLHIALTEKAQIEKTLRIKHELSMYLFDSQNVDEVTRRLITRLGALLPVAGIRLYLYDRNKSWMILSGQTDKKNGNRLKQDEFIHGVDPYPCRYCMFQQLADVHAFRACPQAKSFLYHMTRHGYCLPLSQGSRPVGLLHIYAPAASNYRPEHLALLSNLSPEIANSLDMAMQKKAHEAELLAQTAHNIQLNIARDLHDTIGQNISYLRMKLDLLAETKKQTRAGTAAEIKHLSEVANEAYDLVRGTLAVLQADKAHDLQSLFSRYAEQLAERSDFKIEFSSHGKPKAMSPNEVRQLFYLFREALSNVEKHAHASQVCVEIEWEESNLTLVISDNGRGFNPAIVPYSGHYGLKFMRERAELMKGSLSILSSEGGGTNIVVHVPYA